MADFSVSPCLVAALCSFMQVSRALFVSPIYTWPQLQRIWYTPKGRIYKLKWTTSKESWKMASKPHTAREPAEEPRATVFIPYVAGLSEDVRWVCRRYNIRTVFRSASTPCGQLTRVKDQDPLEKKSGVVYQIPHSCGHVYIGETKRALETCIKEHRAATRWGETEKSAIAEHTWGQHHPILWEETSVLDQAKNNTTLLIKEALYIRLTDFELINRDESVAILECWQLVLDHATMTKLHPHHATPHQETDDGTIDATWCVTFLLASN